MAVQAALMNPHFIPFCFPGSLMDYELEKSYDDGALLGEAQSGDFREATRDLLSFIDSASSNIKLALDKPVKSKRKVNHRKYLQKQIKRCTGIVSPIQEPTRGQPASPGGPHCKPPPKREHAQSSLQSKSLAALFDSTKEARGEKSKKVPLRNRNLPPSFFREPAHATSTACPAAALSLRELERCSAEAAELFELLGTEYGSALSEQEGFHGGTVRIHQDLAAEHALCDPHHLLGGLEYPDPWSQCTATKKPPVGLGSLGAPGQATLYLSDSAMSSPGEETAPHVPAFAPFFADCTLPPMPYEYTTGYCRAGYPAL